ncbi:MAG: copper transporter [Firmicutes bacterium]|nr:copper transporter [Bacillota bacterium]
MFRLRDHIISLVAVFLALGLGILIGTGLAEDMLVTQQRLLIEKMAEDFQSLNQTRKELEAQIQKLHQDLYLWEKYQEALYPLVVEGVLAQQKIAILHHDTSPPPEILEMLEDAQAEITAVIGLEGKNFTGENLVQAGETLAELILGGDPGSELPELLPVLMAKEAVQIDKYFAVRPDHVLLFLGEREKIKSELLSALVATLQNENVSLVGVETSEVKNSCLKEIKKTGASTIDHADTVFGRYSLLSVLQGNAGSFGLKETADEFIATFSKQGREK